MLFLANAYAYHSLWLSLTISDLLHQIYFVQQFLDLCVAWIQIALLYRELSFCNISLIQDFIQPDIELLVAIVFFRYFYFKLEVSVVAQ